MLPGMLSLKTEEDRDHINAPIKCCSLTRRGVCVQHAGAAQCPRICSCRRFICPSQTQSTDPVQSGYRSGPSSCHGCQWRRVLKGGGMCPWPDSSQPQSEVLLQHPRGEQFQFFRSDILSEKCLMNATNQPCIYASSHKQACM